ncbi:MAG: RNA-directed DNA polymerase [Synergistes jonesii]|uniref:RNA-directed DNA polymerase n=1 Tax=Synergistes jonesii TaxID=2754 RepID=UPI002A74D024|nr:RNA-directed DNA polymerase [Synergistes jonesii]MDY2985512.1 RNA-directed DNA polymerase [Synergistes jonesii]
MKTYYDFMNEISADELYEGLLGYGMFSEKLPPVFTAVPFLNYAKTNPGFKKDNQDYVTFRSMRNINIPRLMGIPNPFQYEKLCAELKSSWSKILDHFQCHTVGQSYRISRIHIRKMYDNNTKSYKPSLFEMNYKNWRSDGSPENELLIKNSKASKYVVHADISTCFPSIYSHSLTWALVGKDVAKKSRGGKIWFNAIDKACQRMKNGETHGLLIGPHSSNLLAEIILVAIDKHLWDQGYKFYRNIDDYDCYVDSYETAQKFLNALEFELRQFDLPMNHKKTVIEELPVSSTQHWIHQLNAVQIIASYGKTSYKEVNNYLDVAIKLTDQVKDAAVLKYAIKTLGGSESLTDNGKQVAAARIMHLAVLYPYLVSLMEKYVFEKYTVQLSKIIAFSNALYGTSKRTNNFEGMCYAVYFSLKYCFDIKEIDCKDLITTGDCLCLLFAWLYYRKREGAEMITLRNEAIRLNDPSLIGRNWLFVYESLDATDLDNDWQVMKKKGISFLTPNILMR